MDVGARRGDVDRNAALAATNDPGGDAASSFLTVPPSISLPKGGGAIRGIGEKFGANPVNGGGSMTLPVFASPGRSGFGPQLSLSYDSGSGNGPFGMGWSLAMPAIARKTDKGLPRYRDRDESDVFILAGTEDLVPFLVKDSAGMWKRDSNPRTANGIEYQIDRYRPRIEGSFALIERWTAEETGEIHWRMVSRDNVTAIFGDDAQSRIADRADPLRVFSWLISRSYDDKGNVVAYTYKGEDYAGVSARASHERNRDHSIEGPQRYLKAIYYGNLKPYRPDFAAQDAVAVPPSPSVPADPASPSEWMFELVFDYGEHDPDAPTPIAAANRKWKARPDPFSTYRAAFEIRTHRLCERVLMFHHFSELGSEPCLVRSTNFDYELAGDTSAASESPYTYLRRAWQTGYKRESLQPMAYRSRATPPVEFEYSRPVIAEETRELDGASLKNLPVGTTGPGYQWVDLDGEGLSGVLTEQAGAWFYKPNLGGGQFGPTTVVAEKPSLAMLANGRQHLMDLAGDGELDLVDFGGPVPGLQERHDRGWKRFIPFVSLPNVNWGDPNLRFIDLTGDGFADALVTEDEAFTWYPSLAEDGFAASNRTQHPRDEEQGPHVVFADGTQTIFAADMSGDGLDDLVRIRNGEVCYWPNLGYGTFGAKVNMDNAPQFDCADLFDPRRVRLADVDGSGPADIIYLGREGARLYASRSGNSLSDPRVLPFPVATENLGAVQVADLFGNGTACLVWSSGLPADARNPVRYLDLMGGNKPHLLTRVQNNLGAETRIDYAPSTKYYLADKQAGRPWVTRLPFPVHCVERITVIDHWRATKFSTTFSYHHGHFDGSEREFRGFGRVEQIDVEDYGTFAEGNVDSPYITPDRTLYQPPVKTITWYHTGAALDGDRILSAFVTEYFPAHFSAQVPVSEKALSEPQLDPELDSEEWREALRSCKGMVLRQESYELAVDALHVDASAAVLVRLFTAAAHNCNVRCLQPRSNNRHAVFHVVESEALNYHYELDLRSQPLDPDPRIVHTLNLRYDEYGNPQQSVVVAYGRVGPGDYAHLPRGDLIDDLQAEVHIAYTETRYTKDVVLTALPAGQSSPITHYRLRLPCELLTYELKGIEKTGSIYYGLSDFQDLDLSKQYGHEDPALAPSLAVERKEYHEHADGSVAQKRIVEHTRTLYFDDASEINPPTASCPFGHHGPRGLKYEDYRLSLTDLLLGAVFQQRDLVSGAVIDDKLDWELDTGVSVRDYLDEPIASGLPHLKTGYILGTGIDPSLGGQYWLRSGIAGFASSSAEHFYLPELYTDPFGNVTTLQYDGRDIFVQSVLDALGNSSGVLIDDVSGAPRFDYRVLAPLETVDANANHSEVCFDILGLVVASAVKGKEVNGGWEGDNLDDLGDEIVDPHNSDVVAFCTSNTPNEQKAREWLGSASARFIYHFGDENGLWGQRMAGACTIGRERHAGQQHNVESPLQVSLECADGMGNVLMRKVRAEPDPDSREAKPPLRWIINGLTIVNNKGKPVKQYEPDFSANFGCELPPAAGVASVMYYDAGGRLVRTELPDGTLSRVVLSPWDVKSFDANDTVTEGRWYIDRDPPDPKRPLPRNPLTGELTVSADQRAAWLAAQHADTPALSILDSLGRAVVAVAHNRTEDANGPHEFDGRNWRDDYYLTFTKLDAEGKPLWIRDALGNLVMQYINPGKPTRASDAPAQDDIEAMPVGSVPCYDISGNLLFQRSMDAGDRWTLKDAAGKYMIAWDWNVRNLDGGGVIPERRLFHVRYDALHRPIEHWLRINDDPPALIEAFTYVDADSFKSAAGVTDQAALAAAQARNLIGQMVSHYDPSGRATVERADFKGAAEEITRTLVNDVEAPVVDWNFEDRATLLDQETFVQISEYDALGRVTRLYNWHRDIDGQPGHSNRVAVYVPSYNARGLLDSETLHVRATKQPDADGHATFKPDADAKRNIQAIKRVTWNAKGQRLSLALGNGTITRYTYERETFRLMHTYTRRDASFTTDCAGDADAARPTRPCGVQNLHYTYDPVGNITHVQDDAQETIHFNNQQVEPSNDYTYDALYRLVEAAGRENAAAVGAPAHREGKWPVAPTPSDALTRNYTQYFRYDSVGNIATVRHVAKKLPNQPDGSWTREYAYDYFEDSTRPASNRLWQTWDGGARQTAVTYRHDPHGSMVNLAETEPAKDIRWDWRDMIRALDLEGGGDAFYNYGIDKQRTRKTIKRNATSSEDRIYLGGFELYRRRSAQGVIEEIESLHLFEGEQRVLLVDDVLVTTTQPGPNKLTVKHQTLFRYQYRNQLGSVGVELDELARVISYEEFHPYGTSAFRLMNSAVEAPAKRYRYTGMERDEESGLNYHHSRLYSTSIARWLSPDPIGIEGGINVFVYSSGNPIRRVDPLGLAPKDPIGAQKPYEDLGLAHRDAHGNRTSEDEHPHERVLQERTLKPRGSKKQLVSDTEYEGQSALRQPTDPATIKTNAAMRLRDQLDATNPSKPIPADLAEKVRPENAAARIIEARDEAIEARKKAGKSTASLKKITNEKAYESTHSQLGDIHKQRKADPVPSALKRATSTQIDKALAALDEGTATRGTAVGGGIRGRRSGAMKATLGGVVASVLLAPALAHASSSVVAERAQEGVSEVVSVVVDATVDWVQQIGPQNALAALGAGYAAAKIYGAAAVASLAASAMAAFSATSLAGIAAAGAGAVSVAVAAVAAAGIAGYAVGTGLNKLMEASGLTAAHEKVVERVGIYDLSYNLFFK